MEGSGLGTFVPGDASASPTERSLPRFLLRYGRLTDVPALVRMYRAQSPASRGFYHPFPFDPVRLALVYLWLISARRLLRTAIGVLPQSAAILLVVVPAGQSRPIGYGTVRYVPSRSTGTWVKFGYLVEEGYRGLGLGGSLAYRLMQKAVESGIYLGGGALLATNVPNLNLVRKLGFSPEGPVAPDREAPRATNLFARADLREILQRIDAGATPPVSRRAIVEFEGRPPSRS
ncbi:MAG TPA: GNAT family N-acetyltransferase [Thermoplasmata archaeon]|nr:GNAT family N-acetyltransferase [Thermoplasmata archaeon]